MPTLYPTQDPSDLDHTRIPGFQHLDVLSDTYRIWRGLTTAHFNFVRCLNLGVYTSRMGNGRKQQVCLNGYEIEGELSVIGNHRSATCRSGCCTRKMRFECHTSEDDPCKRTDWPAINYFTFYVQ
ncbi:hypothetical protein Mp_8g12740 [Marchantia polymorpha subsp. ruderalis]|uniref:Uncharacterized protein n=1 Tax=Marchantia polymorpha TaxID=3197 RepID=A0A2R6WJT1_MARPO|nr:hypothetical protein MARPO_0083s0046 [Marchantia polymorpha]BBN19686.1 hypothetical protein Mp_8g12740 [Marchantia polymorpha subsp. ruderalis]|eukprot:PTQ34081.1 hypothetical protein MARPO_0083s0046 [Marchantia polymorpha]